MVPSSHIVALSIQCIPVVSHHETNTCVCVCVCVSELVQLVVLCRVIQTSGCPGFGYWVSIGSAVGQRFDF